MRWLLILVLGVHLAACADKPGGAALEEGKAAFLASEADGLGIYEIRNLRRENGYRLGDYYHVELAFERHFLVGLDEATHRIEQAVSEGLAPGVDQAQPDLASALVAGAFVLAARTGFLRVALLAEYGAFRKGDVIPDIATLRFLQTERGWRFYDFAPEDGDS